MNDDVEASDGVFEGLLPGPPIKITSSPAAGSPFIFWYIPSDDTLEKYSSSNDESDGNSSMDECVGEERFKLFDRVTLFFKFAKVGFLDTGGGPASLLAVPRTFDCKVERKSANIEGNLEVVLPFFDSKLGVAILHKNSSFIDFGKSFSGASVSMLLADVALETVLFVDMVPTPLDEALLSFAWPSEVQNCDDMSSRVFSTDVVMDIGEGCKLLSLLANLTSVECLAEGCDTFFPTSHVLLNFACVLGDNGNSSS